MNKVLLSGVMLAVLSTTANVADAPTIQDAPSWLTNRTYPPPNDGVDLYHPEKYGTLEQQRIPNPFRLEWGQAIPGVETLYAYPTMQVAPAWLIATPKKKPRMYRR